MERENFLDRCGRQKRWTADGNGRDKDLTFERNETTRDKTKRNLYKDLFKPLEY